MKIKRLMFRCVALVLVSVIAYSGYRLWDIDRNYAAEAAFHNRLLKYKPDARILSPDKTASGSLAFVSAQTENTPAANASASGSPAAAPRANRTVAALQAEYPDAIGWLTIPGSGIDYPFVRGADNNCYLHRDLDGNHTAAGTIFMDCRNSRDFSDFNTVLFGHHMKNGSMFGTLQNFDDREFFDANRTGAIFLADKTYEIEFMAFAVVNTGDAVIYDTAVITDGDKTAFLDYVKSAARYYRDVGASTDSQIVTLSSCNYEFQNARMVLIGKLVERQF